MCALRGCETGSMVYHPHPRKLVSLTICRCNYKGSTLSSWFKVLDKSGQVDVLFIDFSRAFDLVCHDILLAKLYKYGVPADLLK